MSLWIKPAIENPENDHTIRFNSVVDRIGKGFCEKPKIAKNLPMNSCIYAERLQICIETIQKIVPQSRGLPFVEMKSRKQILLCEPVKLDFHIRRSLR